jgi:hypothetical protein
LFTCKKIHRTYFVTLDFFDQRGYEIRYNALMRPPPLPKERPGFHFSASTKSGDPQKNHNETENERGPLQAVAEESLLEKRTVGESKRASRPARFRRNSV